MTAWRAQAIAVIATALWLAALPGELQAQILNREPARGQLSCGKVVLVDDGKCPKGQIAEVTGGCNAGKGGSTAQGAGRQRRCVPR